jgi:hypothetical protein
LCGDVRRHGFDHGLEYKILFKGMVVSFAQGGMVGWAGLQKLITDLDMTNGSQGGSIGFEFARVGEREDKGRI